MCHCGGEGFFVRFKMTLHCMQLCKQCQVGDYKTGLRFVGYFTKKKEEENNTSVSIKYKRTRKGCRH